MATKKKARKKASKRAPLVFDIKLRRGSKTHAQMVAPVPSKSWTALVRKLKSLATAARDAEDAARRLG